MTTTTINNVIYTVTPGPQMPALTSLGYDGFVYWLRSAGQRVKAFRRQETFVIVYSV